jgi:hypothetical protein
MKTLSAFRWLFPLGLGLGTALGCGDAGGKGTGLSGGDGGSSAQSGSAGSVAATGGGGTSSGSTGKGGTGTIQVGGSGGGTSGSAGAGPVCNSLTAKSTLIVPTVLLLVDNSSSMFDENGSPVTAWSLLYDALMDPADGVVKPLASDIRFGFASYKGHQASSETDMACATMTPATPTYALDNYAAIDTVYAMLGSETNNGTKWETPTGHAITRVLPSLVAFQADPPGPKYILLVTDGNPNTCKTIDPQCGQDRTIAAVQAAWAQGVGTFVIGIGDIVTSPDNGCNDQSRCGKEHLQDVANAGMGLPVQAPPTDYKYQPCVQSETGDVVATYAAAGETPGTAPYFATNDGAMLRKNLGDLLFGVASCTFDLDAVVTGDPRRSNVTLDGDALGFGDTAGGWTLEDNKYQVTLQGSACEKYRSGDGHDVSIQFLCDEMGMPVAEPR